MALSMNLSPKQKRMGMFGIAALAVALVVMVLPDKKGSHRTSRRQNEMTNFLTDTNTRSLGIDGLGVELRKMRGVNRDLQRQIEELKNNPMLKSQVDIQRLNDRLASSMKQMNQLAANIETLRKENERLQRKGLSERSSAVGPGSQDVTVPVLTIGGSDGTEGPSPASTEPPNPRELFQQTPTPARAGGSAGSRSTAAGQGPGKRAASAIRLIEADPNEEKKAKNGEKKKGFYLPAGSMMTGVLITGLDAPTGTKTRSEPYPVLVRIKHDTILPNRYRANFRECFVLASGYGDLSSERAYLRAERLSCIRTDNGVVDIPLDAYASGEDGKVGLRGTLVSKQGQVLNKALIAGVAQGFSQAFQSYRVPTINTNGNSNAQYQQIISPEALTSAGLNGVGTALEKLADFYLDQAQQMFPIIEIHAGRKVTFIFTRGMTIDFI